MSLPQSKLHAVLLVLVAVLVLGAIYLDQQSNHDFALDYQQQCDQKGC